MRIHAGTIDLKTQPCRPALVLSTLLTYVDLDMQWEGHSHAVISASHQTLYRIEYLKSHSVSMMMKAYHVAWVTPDSYRFVYVASPSKRHIVMSFCVTTKIVVTAGRLGPGLPLEVRVPPNICSSKALPEVTASLSA